MTPFEYAQSLIDLASREVHIEVARRCAPHADTAMLETISIEPLTADLLSVQWKTTTGQLTYNAPTQMLEDVLTERGVVLPSRDAVREPPRTQDPCCGTTHTPEQTP